MLWLSEAHEICGNHSFIHLVLSFIILLNLLGTSPFLTVREIATKIKRICLYVRVCPKRMNFVGNRSFDVRVLLCFSIY